MIKLQESTIRGDPGGKVPAVCHVRTLKRDSRIPSGEPVMKVLIAEDERTSRRVLTAVLTQWKYEVVSTVDGEQAWEKLKEDDAPRLAILDWMMPGMDGFEVCRRLRQGDTRNPTYVILLTSRDGKEDIIEGLGAGADDYVAKPFDTGELRARIEVGCRVIELQATLTQRIDELEDALNHVKTLQGILPICMHCHKIRNDQESWERIEKYIGEHTEAQFSHGLCPECRDKYYPNTGRE